MSASKPTPKQEERRRKILRVARKIFLAEGYDAASMSAIAAKLGGSKGTLYNYFPSKAALFGAVLESYFDQVRELMEGLNLGAGDVAPRLTEFGYRFLDLLLEDDFLALYRLVTAEAARFPEIGAAFQANGINARKAELSAFFEAAMAAGAMRQACPQRAAKQFIDLCRSDLQRQVLWNIIPRPPEAELRRQAAEATGAIMALYAP